MSYLFFIQLKTVFTVSTHKEYLHIKIEIEEGVNFMKRNSLLGSLGCLVIELKLGF